jgi:hypothetical protein
MELKQLTSTTANSMTSSEQSYEISKEVKALGLAVRYDTIRYRDQEINFLSDPAGVRCYAQWNNRLIDLGLNNLYYKEDACRFIDRQLDLITDFRDCPNFVGAKLEYFHNGDYRDIRLSYKGRILKIFLVAGPVNENWIISESQKILTSSGLLEDML